MKLLLFLSLIGFYQFSYSKDCSWHLSASPNQKDAYSKIKQIEILSSAILSDFIKSNGIPTLANVNLSKSANLSAHEVISAIPEIARLQAREFLVYSNGLLKELTDFTKRSIDPFPNVTRGSKYFISSIMTEDKVKDLVTFYIENKEAIDRYLLKTTDSILVNALHLHAMKKKERAIMALKNGGERLLSFGIMSATFAASFLGLNYLDSSAQLNYEFAFNMFNVGLAASTVYTYYLYFTSGNKTSALVIKYNFELSEQTRRNLALDII